MALDLAGVDLERGEQVLGAVAGVLVVAAGGPARGGLGVGPSGRASPLAWMPVFSSIETTSAF